MPRTALETAVLTHLHEQEDLVPALWGRVSNSLGAEVALSDFFDAIYHLRNDGLVEYDSRTLSESDLQDLLTELTGDSPFTGSHDEESRMVRIAGRNPRASK